MQTQRNRPAFIAPSRQQRRHIALVTCGFIGLSAVMHVLLGGTIRPPRTQVEPSPSVTAIALYRLETPTPSPPTPRPSPTPTFRPTLQPVQTSAPPTMAPKRHNVAVIAPPRHRSTDAPPQSSGGSSGDANDTGDDAPSAAAVPDDRYIIVSARFLNQVRPVYPLTAATQGEEGTVIVLLTIGPSGVRDVRVWQSSGYADLDNAALQAAKESAYSLPEVNGEPATETYRIVYTFSLDK